MAVVTSSQIPPSTTMAGLAPVVASGPAPDVVVGPPPDVAVGPPPDVVAAAVLAALRARGQTLAVAESLTGGLLSATIVGVPGASAAFRGGLVVYATDLKASLAGVDAGLLARHGAVDGRVAGELADGARARCGADWGLGTTGVAGPDPQDGQPVGTAYLGLVGPDGRYEVRRLALTGDRSVIRVACVAAALTLLAEHLSG